VAISITKQYFWSWKILDNFAFGSQKFWKTDCSKPDCNLTITAVNFLAAGTTVVMVWNHYTLYLKKTSQIFSILTWTKIIRFL